MPLAQYRLKNPIPEMTPQAAPGAFPGSTVGVLAPVPIMTPAGPTDLGFLYQQMQGMGFLATAQTWTQPQSFAATSPAATSGVVNLTLTDTGGGSDSDTLRPAHLILQHNTTLATVAGVGTSIFFQVKDVAGTTVRIGKTLAEITTTTAGAVDSTMTWCVQKGGVEVEGFRLRGGVGFAALTDPANSTAGGKVGGQLTLRCQLLALGTTTVNNLPLTLAIFQPQLSTGSVLAGFGSEHLWQSADGSGTVVPLARQQVLIATATTGAVDTLMAWSIRMGGQEIEVMRAQAVGMAPANTGGITGWIGGRLRVNAEFMHAGTGLGFFSTSPVSKPTVSGSRGSNAALASLLSALATLGLVTDSSS